ncbi:MAG: alpha/beta fold hydrolase [Actinomycetota bacterium]|nr:alpha/beta fold hydrolase [Actinomycetota bacterium]
MATRTSEDLTAAGLHVNVWPGSGTTVLGLAGIGSSGRSFSALAADLGDAHVVAPDLRGRGRTAGGSGPTGLRAHARDVAAVLDELDLRDVVVVGHSMGAFLAPLVAEEAAGRVSRLVLVDGGLPSKLPFFMTRTLTRVTFRRQFARADRDWADAETLTAKLAGKTLDARPDLRPVVVEMLSQDLAGRPGALRPMLDARRAAEDAVDTFFNPDVVGAIARVHLPVHLVTATGGKHDAAKPFLSEAVVAEWLGRLPGLTAQRLPGNHVTVLFAPEVAAAVAG